MVKRRKRISKKTDRLLTLEARKAKLPKRKTKTFRPFVKGVKIKKTGNDTYQLKVSKLPKPKKKR